MDKTPENVKRRVALFRQIDMNGNGQVSLAEMDKAVLSVLQCKEIFNAKPVIVRAFNASKNAVKSNGKNKFGDDQIQLHEFRIFLVQLRQFFEQWVMFKRLDTSGDRRLDLDEFKKAIPTLEQWGISVSNPLQTFKEIDFDGAGFVLFDEFCVWAAAQNIDIDDDDDLEVTNDDINKLNSADIKINKYHKTDGFKSQNKFISNDSDINSTQKSMIKNDYTSLLTYLLTGIFISFIILIVKFRNRDKILSFQMTLNSTFTNSILSFLYTLTNLVQCQFFNCKPDVFNQKNVTTQKSIQNTEQYQCYMCFTALIQILIISCQLLVKLLKNVLTGVILIITKFNFTTLSFTDIPTQVDFDCSACKYDQSEQMCKYACGCVCKFGVNNNIVGKSKQAAYIKPESSHLNSGRNGTSKLATYTEHEKIENKKNNIISKMNKIENSEDDKTLKTRGNLPVNSSKIGKSLKDSEEKKTLKTPGKLSKSSSKLNMYLKNSEEKKPRSTSKEVKVQSSKVNKMKVNWKEIHDKLPMEKTPADKKRRDAMFRQFDPNGNGFLSLAEIDKGMRDVLECDSLFDAKPAIMRAFQSAKNAVQSKGNDTTGDDQVQLSEFRLFLVFLRQIFEYFVMFKELDTTGDQRIGLEEFKMAVPTLEKWGVNIADAKASFNEIDVNGGGIVLFDEFVIWATSKNLDLEDDDNNDCQSTLRETELVKSKRETKGSANKKVVKKTPEISPIKTSKSLKDSEEKKTQKTSEIKNKLVSKNSLGIRDSNKDDKNIKKEKLNMQF